MAGPLRMSLEEYRRQAGLPSLAQVERQEAKQPKKRRKFGNTPTDYESPLVGHMKYPSKKQAERAKELDLLWQAGEIRWWLPEIPIRLKGYTETRQHIMRVDFLILWADGRLTWEDAKGILTPAWELKRDLVADQYGITVETV